MAFRLFFHSLRMVFSQIKDTLRISALLYLASAALYIFVLLFMARSVETNPAAVFGWQMAIATLLSSFLYMWVAIAWHRYILLDETPNTPLPPILGDRLLSYFGRSVQVTLLGLLGTVAVMTVIGLLATLTNGSPAFAVLVFVMMFATFVIAVIILYRISPVFPAAAIGQSLGIAQAWAATRGAGGSLLGLAVISVIASYLIDLPTVALQYLPFGGILMLIWMAITGWIKLMVGVSIITTLYGVYVDKRAIA